MLKFINQLESHSTRGIFINLYKSEDGYRLVAAEFYPTDGMPDDDGFVQPIKFYFRDLKSAQRFIEPYKHKHVTEFWLNRKAPIHSADVVLKILRSYGRQFDLFPELGVPCVN